MGMLVRWLESAFGPYLLIAVGVLFLGLGAAAVALKLELAGVRTEFAQHMQADADAEAKAQGEARQREADHARVLAEADMKHHEELDHEKAEAERILRAERAGTIQLRERFRACWANLPHAVPSAGSSDAGPQSGLQREDVEFFVHFANDADEVVRQLELAQAVIRQDRVTCGPHTGP